ncbi:MAG: hypothetical protein QM764_18465 [Chitinophagaceae bacterium]
MKDYVIFPVYLFGLTFTAMPFSTGKYYNWPRVMLAMCVYICFFTVQLFCITAPDSSAVITPLHFHKAKEKQNSVDNPQDHVKKTRLSINKRFQHAIGDILLTNLENVTIHHPVQLYSIRPTEYLLISSILATSLRVPPPANA